jgi:hypothetical protein
LEETQYQNILSEFKSFREESRSHRESLREQLHEMERKNDVQHGETDKRLVRIETGLFGDDDAGVKGIVKRVADVEKGHGNLKSLVYRYRNLGAGIITGVTIGINLLMYFIREIFAIKQ